MSTSTSYFKPVVVVLMLAALAASLMMAGVLASSPARAASLSVDTADDELNADGDCSLREAIEAANTNLAVDGCAAGSPTDRDTIRFALGAQATITLGSALPSIDDPSGLTIDGQKNKITLNGDDKVVGVLQVFDGAKLALLHLTVANARWGGLYNAGQVKVTKSTFSGNGNRRGTGGGIWNDRGTLTVSNSTFSGNSAERGGGIANTGVGTVTVSNSTFSGNRASELFPQDIGVGGGIYMHRGTVTVNNSTFSGNDAVRGGGIWNHLGTLTVSNSTFSGNSASARQNSGGIANTGGANTSVGTVTLKNTIVANSSPQGNNCFGERITDGGYNLEDGTSCRFSAANHSLPSTEPKLQSSLANNGGPTKTIRLLKGSPAINAIPKTTNGCGTQITTDQRGVKRPQGKGCDIGAFEKRQ
jgi:CSLREA domain-containing protein